MRSVFGIILIVISLALNLYHTGVARPPELSPSDYVLGKGSWYDKKEYGINHLVVEGSAYQRGLIAGKLTAPLLLKQEQSLLDQLTKWIPYRWLQQAAILGLIAWYNDADQYIDRNHLAEMYGVSKSAPHEYDFLADGYTRQIAYHGLHEVGQMVIDGGFAAMGCTVVATPFGSNWIIGRNFDFEGGHIFDTEKIVKWVFPNEGHAFVSVIWAGMVGAVTGVNEQGLYVSLNAAGSSDFRRVGMPSTLLAAKILQETATIGEAVAILNRVPMFITDIMIISDQSGHLVRVEKSPQRTVVLPVETSTVVTNHLESTEFSNDPTNRKRMANLTSVERKERGARLISTFRPTMPMSQIVNGVLNTLRDKGIDAQGRPLNLGNRLAIDALIATHSVIYNSSKQVLYVSQGPSLVGPLLGYDLRRSFAARHPVPTDKLPADPIVDLSAYNEVLKIRELIDQANQLIRLRRPAVAREILQQAPKRANEDSEFLQILGDTYNELGQRDQARDAWKRALDQNPAYAFQRRDLMEKLKQ